MSLNRSLMLLCVLGALLSVLSACTPDEEKIAKVFQAGIDECKKSDKDFADVEMFNKNKETVLRAACDEPLGKVTIQDSLYGSAQMGPYQWLAGIDKASGTWVLTGVVWDDLSQAKRLVELKDSELEDLERAETSLAAAQEKLPNSAWIRLNRLKNHLNIQAFKRRKEKDPVPTIGDQSKAYLDTLLAWAKEQNQPEAAAHARLAVIDYLRRYKSITQDGIDSLGSGDDHLERVIAQAKLEKDKDTEQKYTETLEKERAERPIRQGKLEERLKAIQALLCAEAAALSSTDLKDEALKERVTTTKSGMQCGS